MTATTRWIYEYALAAIAAMLILFAVATAVYAWVYHKDQSAEEILDESFEIVRLTEDTATLHIYGRKNKGHPIQFTAPRKCPINGLIRNSVEAEPRTCTPGEMVEVMTSPAAYGIRADGRRRPIALSGGTVKNYPEGTFDAGEWTFDISPRFEGDPPIIAVEMEVVHERRFGPVTERMAPFPLHVTAPIPSASRPRNAERS